jgi:hypothetical protein
MEENMNLNSWGPVLFGGILFLMFPLPGTATIEAVDGSIKIDQEKTDSILEPPVGKSFAPRDLLRYLTANAGKLKPLEVDKTLWRLFALQSQYLTIYESQLFSEPMNSKINRYHIYQLTNIQKIEDGEIRSLVTEIRSDAFELHSAEGMIYVEIDFPLISSHFGRYASVQMSDYLKIMARETALHFAEDGALKISPRILGERIMAIETFLCANKRFTRKKELTQLGQNYLFAYLLGLNNTPAFNYRTHRLDSRFLQSYRQIIAKYPATRFAALVQEYLKVLSKNDFKKTKLVLDFVTLSVTNFTF